MTKDQLNFQEDYSSFGHNRAGLMFNSSDAGLQGILGTPVSDPLNPSNFKSGATYKDLTVQKLVVGGGKQITINSDEDIQRSLDELNEAGGGVLYLSPGTYKPRGSISVYSTIRIEGVNATDTIIDFDSNSYGFLLTGTDVYTTGTISSISSGVLVAGSGTTWTSDMAGRQIFIDERWYVISSVTDATNLVLESGYADGATFSGTYRIANPVIDVVFSRLKIKNSTTTAITGTDVRDLSLLNCVFLDNNKGFSLTNFMNVVIDTVINISATSNGYELTNGSFCNNYSHASVANGGNGAALNNCKICGWILSASNSNTTDGFDIVDCDNLLFNCEASGNGGKGFDISKTGASTTNTCVTLDGTGDYVSTTNNLGITGGNCSLSFWVKLNAEIGSGTWTLMEQGSATNFVRHFVEYEYNGGTRRLTFNREKSGTANHNFTYNITLGTTSWYHIGLSSAGTVAAGGALVGYVNGVSVGSTGAGGAGASTAIDITLVGARYDFSQTTNGRFAHAAVWNSALTAANMSQLFISIPNTADSTMQLYWPMDEGTGTVVADDKNDFDGVLTNGTWASDNPVVYNAYSTGILLSHSIAKNNGSNGLLASTGILGLLVMGSDFVQNGATGNLLGLTKFARLVGNYYQGNVGGNIGDNGASTIDSANAKL